MGLPPSLAKLTVNGELYFTGHFSGLPHGLTLNYWATKVANWFGQTTSLQKAGNHFRGILHSCPKPI